LLADPEASRGAYAGADIKLSGDKPYLHAPVMNYAARVSVSKEAPSAVGANVAHDMSLFDGSGEQVCPINRRLRGA
jgi:hypothetical protein